MNFIVTIGMKDKSTLDLEYKLFDNEHSQIWFESLKKYCDSKIPLTDTERVYNFNPSNLTLDDAIKQCNNTIEKINNQIHTVQIPFINYNYLQDSINNIHKYFVDSDRGVEYTKSCESTLWSDLNADLHGLEAIVRRKNSNEPQGQIFIELPYREQYDLPESAYQYFTVKKTFGYCYANYPHVGRHIYEMFQANDDDIENEHIVPMHQIAGSLHLWFGKTTSNIITDMRIKSIEDWFTKNKVDKKINMNWGDPKLAIGWLPVAEIISNVTQEELINTEKVIKIEYK